MSVGNNIVPSKGAISIRNVTKVYDPGGADVMAVDDCSLEIAAGEVCMIVGP
ncbi:MAG: ABC transporter ATP-binding protein, partial [Proteobacteria bacterium]|nr:ABC transporter ATP-binding protein [Pseudomonadota bacterium]